MGRKSQEQKRTENIREGNRQRQAARYARQKAAGKKLLKIWATPDQKKLFRAVEILVRSDEGIKIAQEVLLETITRLRKEVI